MEKFGKQKEGNQARKAKFKYYLKKKKELKKLNWNKKMLWLDQITN